MWYATTLAVLISTPPRFTPLPITPEVATTEQKKPKRSVKSQRPHSQKPVEAAIQAAPESTAIETPVNGTPVKPVYEWDRTVSENAERANQALISRSPFPTPKNTTMQFPELCEFYNGLRELPVGRYAKLYVQRFWPVLLPVEDLDDFGNLKESFPSDVKITAEDGPLSQQLLLQLAGVGEYKFRLNDSRRPWKQQTVVFSELAVTDPTFWTLHPPIIDPKRLDLDAKRNQAYIKFARSHGYLPHEGQVEQEQSDMATATIAQSALTQSKEERDRNDRLQAELLAESRRREEEAKASAAKAQSDAARAIAAAAESKPSAPASDLVSTVGALVGIVNAIKPAPDNSLNEYLKLEQAREETRRKSEADERARLQKDADAARDRAERMQAQMIEDLKASRTAAAAQVPVTAPTEVEILEREVRKKALLKQLYGGGTAEEEKPDSLDKWAEILPHVAPVFQSIVHGIFQLGHAVVQGWQVTSYNAALGRNGAQPQPPTTMPQNAQQPAQAQPKPGEPMQPQQPPPDPAQQAIQAQWNQIMMGIQRLAPIMLNHLKKGKGGAELAEFVIENAEEERIAYDKIRHLADSLRQIGVAVEGANEIEQFINSARFVFQQIPPLWKKLETIPAMPQFLTEFYNYDQIREEEQRLAEQGEQG